MNTVLPYTTALGNFLVSDAGYCICICKTENFKKERIYLDIRIIRLLSLSLSHGYARQDINYSLIISILERILSVKFLSSLLFYPNLYIPPLHQGRLCRIRRRYMPVPEYPVPVYAADFHL